MDKITQRDVVILSWDQSQGLRHGDRQSSIISPQGDIKSCHQVAGPRHRSQSRAIGVKVHDANNARERYLTVEETERLRNALGKSANPNLKSIVELLILLGCRKRELLDSRWSDFDLERRSWRIPISKSGKSRHVPLFKAALEVLAQLPRYEVCPYLLPNPATLKPYASIWAGWDTARKAAGLADVRMHDLRHSCASFMVNSGRSLYEVSKVLGHSELKTTQRYAHLSQDTLLAAVDAGANATGMSWGTSSQEETRK